MKILFIDDSQNTDIKHPQHIMPSMEIGYASTIIKNKIIGSKVKLLDLRLDNKNTINKISKYNPDFIFYKPNLKSINKINLITKKLVNLKNKIICFGPFPILYPDKILKNTSVKLIIDGDIEQNIVNIINYDKLNQKGIIYIKNNKIIRTGKKLITNYDKFPLPDYKLFIKKQYQFLYPLQTFKHINIGFLETSRGCPYNCKFCSIFERSSLNKKYKPRSHTKIIDEIEMLVKFGINGIYFKDDNFLFDKVRIGNLCNEIIKRKLNKKITWACQARIDDIDDKLIKLMKKAGLSTISLGVESGSNKILKELGKDITSNDILKANSILRHNKIWIVGYFILGAPNETKEDINLTKKIIKQIKPEILQLHFLKKYKDSIYKSDDSLKDTYTLELKNKKYQKYLENEYIEIYKKYYLNLKYLVHIAPKISPYYFFQFKNSAKLVLKTLKMVIKK